MLLALIATAHALTLDEAWSSADASGVEGQLVRSQYAAAKTITGAAWSLVSPKLVFKGNWTRNDKALTFDSSAFIPESLQGLFPASDPIVVRKLSYFDANASVIQPLFSGQALPLLKAAYGEVHAAEADQRVALGQIRVGVAQAFWGVIVAREGEKLASEALESARRHRALVDKQADVGLAPPTARLQAEIAESRADRELAAAVDGRTTAEQALARLTHQPADVAVDPPGERQLPWDSAEDAIDRAAVARPGLQAASQRAKDASLQATAQALDWLPNVNGRFTYVWTQNTSAFADDPEFWMFVVEGEWVLWDGGYRLSKQKKSAEEKHMASLAEARELETASADIRELWVRHEKAEKALSTVRHEAELATENLRLAEVAWKAGSITFLELQDAQLGEKAARLGVVQEEMNRDLAAIQLLVAVGEL